MHTTCSVEGFNGRRASGRGFHALAAPPPWLDTRPFLSTRLAPHCRGEKHQDARPSSTLSPLLPLPLHPDSRAHATVTVAAIAARARARGGYAASVHHCLSCAPLRVRAPPGEPPRTFPGQDRRRGTAGRGGSAADRRRPWPRLLRAVQARLGAPVGARGPPGAARAPSPPSTAPPPVGRPVFALPRSADGGRRRRPDPPPHDSLI
jgi:hypothetical protein